MVSDLDVIFTIIRYTRNYVNALHLQPLFSSFVSLYTLTQSLSLRIFWNLKCIFIVFQCIFNVYLKCIIIFSSHFKLHENQICSSNTQIIKIVSCIAIKGTNSFMYSWMMLHSFRYNRIHMHLWNIHFVKSVAQIMFFY